MKSGEISCFLLFEHVKCIGSFYCVMRKLFAFDCGNLCISFFFATFAHFFVRVCASVCVCVTNNV